MFSAGLAISLALLVMMENKVIAISAIAFFTISLINRIKLLILSLLIASLILLTYFLYLPTELNGEINGTYQVMQVTSMGPVILVNGQKVLVRESNFEYFFLDKIHVQGLIETPTSTPSFDLVNYLKGNNIVNIIDRPEVRLMQNSNNPINKLNKYIFSGDDLFSMYAPLLLLGDKTTGGREMYQLTLEMNIVHLLVISGFHISLVARLIKRLLKLAKVNEKHCAIASWIPILMYLIVLDLSLSAFRAVLFIIFCDINKYFLKNKKSRLDILTFIVLIMVISQPYKVFSISFLYSFIASFAIQIVLITCGEKKRKYIFLAIAPYFSTLPISILINGWTSLFGILFGFMLGPVFMIVYILTLVLLPFRTILNFIFLYFNELIVLISKMNYLIYFEISLEHAQYIILLMVISTTWEKDYQMLRTSFLLSKLKYN